MSDSKANETYLVSLSQDEILILVTVLDKASTRSKNEKVKALDGRFTNLYADLVDSSKGFPIPIGGELDKALRAKQLSSELLQALESLVVELPKVSAKELGTLVDPFSYSYAKGRARELIERAKAEAKS